MGYGIYRVVEIRIGRGISRVPPGSNVNIVSTQFFVEIVFLFLLSRPGRTCTKVRRKTVSQVHLHWGNPTVGALRQNEKTSQKLVYIILSIN